MIRPTKEEIRELPLYKGLALNDINIIENKHDADDALKKLQTEVCLGFDTESKPVFNKGEKSPGPTLIQLSTPEKAYLFPTRFPVAVAAARKILSDPKIEKVGFGIKNDNKELRNKLNIEIANTQDLSITLKNLAGEKNSVGARAAVAMVLKLRLGKGAQKSNWSAYPLKNSQILYAANDAHSAICVQKALMTNYKINT